MIQEDETLYYPDLAKREADIKAQIEKLQDELHEIHILRMLRKASA